MHGTSQEDLMDHGSIHWTTGERGEESLVDQTRGPTGVNRASMLHASKIFPDMVASRRIAAP